MQRLLCERKRPRECSETELLTFANLVVQGGQVQQTGLLAHVRTALWLGFGKVDGTLASVAAVKVPRAAYRDRVFRNATSSQCGLDFNLEFGWAFTLLEFERKGLGSTLADLLLEDIREPIFATTGTENQAMRHILRKRGFCQLGSHYEGRRESKLLFVRTYPF